jgi:hypothetical protein
MTGIGYRFTLGCPATAERADTLARISLHMDRLAQDVIDLHSGEEIQRAFKVRIVFQGQ